MKRTPGSCASNRRKLATATKEVANLGNTAHAADAVERGAEGVGLLRTEFLFMAYSSAPNLATQIAEYREATDALDGRPLVARTLDIGGDGRSTGQCPRKTTPSWPAGIRLALTQPDVLETQIRALLMAAVGKPLRIMLPMVKDVAEFRTAKAIYDRLLNEIPRSAPPTCSLA